MARTKLETQCVRGIVSGRIEVAVWGADCRDEGGRMFHVWLSAKEARRLRDQLTEELNRKH